MADIPRYIDEDADFNYADALEQPRRRPSPPPIDAERVGERRRGYAAGIDLYLTLVVGVLCAIGLMMVYSASIDVSFQVTGDPNSTTYFFVRQLRSMIVGVILAFFLSRADYHVWRRLAVPMMLGVIAMLVAVLRFGEVRFEAQRALIGGSLQPGELAKFTVVLYMAAWLAAKRSRLRNPFYGVVPFSILVGTIAFLIVLQPDLSTAASILATALSMFFIAGADLIQLILIGGAMVVAGWQLIMRLAYARERLVALIYRGFTIARYAPDSFGALLAAGVTCWIACDALLNMAVMTNLLPPTGVPLPFISYGGSSLVAVLCGVGLMLNVSRAISRNAMPKRRQE
jgi:cell division protein FtsW (lipid II flippase)